MRQCGMTIGKTRSWMYWLARLLGDVSAVSQGPGAIGKRLARRVAGKGTGRLLGKLFR